MSMSSGMFCAKDRLLIEFRIFEKGPAAPGRATIFIGRSNKVPLKNGAFP